MKLKQELFIQPVGPRDFSFYVDQNSRIPVTIYMNKTASFIIGLLQEEITKEEIVEKMMAKYRVNRETCIENVNSVLSKLKEKGLL